MSIQLDREQEQSGGFHLSKRVMLIALGCAVLAGILVVNGVRAHGASEAVIAGQSIDDPNQAARDREANDELRNAVGSATSTPAGSTAVVPVQQQQTAPAKPPPHQPTQYEQWAHEKWMKALEAPQMVSAFHGGDTMTIARADVAQSGEQSIRNRQGAGSNPAIGSAITLNSPAPPNTVMAGSVIPAEMISGIDSDMPGPVIAQVSENVFDTHTGRTVVIPQGARLIGSSGQAVGWATNRVAIAWKRLIFPDTSSMDLPMMPGADAAGFSGFTDQVDHHYVATFGMAAVMSLISAGQQVGQSIGGQSSYGAYGEPNQMALLGQQAGAGASNQFGAVGAAAAERGMNRAPTIDIRPGYKFNVMVTEDLQFPAGGSQ